jgi:antitoxin component of MazEF toxin-antitoxin module
MPIVRKLGKRSTSVSLTVPTALAAALDWAPGTLVMVEVAEGGLMVRAMPTPTESEATPKFSAATGEAPAFGR